METADGYAYYDEARKEVVRLLRELPAASRVLDVGAGFGNNARVLLEHGCTVVATETSQASRDRLGELRLSYPGRLLVRSESIVDLADAQAFDAAVCTMVLHFLPEPQGREGLRRLQDAVKPGGLCVVTSYLVDSRLPAEYQWQMRPGELREHFRRWEIVHSEETYPFTLRTIRTTPQLLRWLRGRRGYKAARIIARRPIGSRDADVAAS